MLSSRTKADPPRSFDAKVEPHGTKPSRHRPQGPSSAAGGRLGRQGVLTSITVLLALVLAACGSSSSPSSTSSASKADQATSTAAASAAIAPFIGRPSAFPVKTPLGKKLPPGTKFAYLQCSTTICALVGQLLGPAVKRIGATMTIVNSGATASSSQAAVSSVLAMKPAAVLVAGVDPAQFGGGLKQLSDAGVKVVSISVSKATAPFGITFDYIGAATAESGGRLMADWVIARQGVRSNIVFYGVPALDFSSYMQKAFTGEVAKNCPSCKVRTVALDIATVGTTAPQTVTTDLQSHNGTTVAVFATSEATKGLPAALSAAGLKVATLGYAPTPGNLQDIKDGKLTAGLGVDLAVSGWVVIDAAARLILGELVTPEEQAGEVPRQFLEQKDITFDPSHGWTGYPDFPQRFAKLWVA